MQKNIFLCSKNPVISTNIVVHSLSQYNGPFLTVNFLVDLIFL